MAGNILGDLTIGFKADLTGLMSGMKSAQSAIQKLSSGSSGMMLPIAGVAALGAAAIIVGGQSVKMAGDFQQSMLKISAYAGLSKTQMDSMSQSVLVMATRVGQSPKALADALYPLISSGYSASEALAMLELSAKTSAASGAKLSVVADALSTSLKAMHAPASQAGLYMDDINKIVALGKGEVAQYAAVIGKLALSAGSAQVPFNDMGAALATLTTHGFPSVAQAATSLSNLFTQIGPKVDALAAHAKKLHLSFDEASFKTMNLSEKLAYLQKITGGNQGELLKLVGGSTVALKAFNALEGSTKDFTSNLLAMHDATGTTDSAFRTASSGWNASMARLQATGEVLMVKIGMGLLPVLSKIVNAVTPIVASFGNWIVQNNVVQHVIDAVTIAINGLGTGIGIAIQIINGTVKVVQNIAAWFVKWQQPIEAVSIALLVFFGPALVQAGVKAVVAGAQIAASFIANLVATGVAATVNAAKVTASFVMSVIQAGAEAWTSGGKIIGGFVASMVQTGAMAVVNGAKVTASFIASMAEAGAKAVWAAAQVTASFIASMVQAGIQAAITAGTFLATLIPAVISFAAEALIAAATAIPAILAGFAAWVVGAGAVAIANIIAFWPIYLIVLGIVIVIALVVLAVQHWGQISGFVKDMWQRLLDWFHPFWVTIQGLFTSAINAIGNFIKGAAAWLYTVFVEPWIRAWAYLQFLWAVLHILFDMGVKKVKQILQAGIDILYNTFVAPFVRARDTIMGIFATIQQAIQNVMNNPFIRQAAQALHIPGFASGVTNFGGGYAMVGEHGPELMYLPQGTNIYPSGHMPSPSGGGSSGSGGHGTPQLIVIHLDSRELGRAVGNSMQKEIHVKTRVGR